MLAGKPVPTRAELARAISHVILHAGYEVYQTFARGFGVRDPAEVTLELLAVFGAITDAPVRRITPLGRWALSVIGTRRVSLLGSSDDLEEDGTYQLKIALQHVRPACWRRVLMPASATLGELHEVIQIAFAWDGDHLHGFTVGRRQYGDPYFDFDYDEHEITLAAAFARARKPITYTYDFGDDWRHEITLEKVVEPTPSATLPICVDGRGDAPVEDCVDDELVWIAFDKAGINTRLAQLGSGAGGRSATS
ncbi:plasmid pRiA4b ORF-3 family protein [Saccharopolyspora pogona]|uniref:plasmid pRiA4b ORF-3 family protein n=1 Tax=Saccharopolyspora pogona TaxID=333966 RepID=UPI001CC24381|nr:plasmid pRiA4b ORF-3 family protein [Saccharopolyspora pogona]